MPTINGVWIDGGTHAREWISPAAVTYILNELVVNWDNHEPYIRDLAWYIMPVVNPDGYEYSHTHERLWRKNRRDNGTKCPGVDIDRNYKTYWDTGVSSDNPCSDVYRGKAERSEIETKYILKYFLRVNKYLIRLFLTFHSYGQYILYPWHGSKYVLFTYIWPWPKK